MSNRYQLNIQMDVKQTGENSSETTCSVLTVECIKETIPVTQADVKAVLTSAQSLIQVQLESL